MKLIAFAALLVAISLPVTVSADPVFYYLYENPVTPDDLQQYGPAGPPGSDVVCLESGACGIKASLVVTVSPGEDAHQPNETFADWRACLQYARVLTKNNAGGFKFFCLGTDNKAFW
ncbi:MAG TPA: hypothetical protein VMA98_01285 [Candidatus Acidoferrales bacterium]|nr:hypothetical protein [Candidatus Acidoferrales bacterium]